VALSNCPFQALGITFFWGPPFLFTLFSPSFPFFFLCCIPILLYLFIYLLFSFFFSFSAVLYSLTVFFLSLYYYLLPECFTFNFFFVLLTSYRPLSFFSLYIYFYLCSYLFLQVTLLHRHKPPSTSIFLFMYTKFIMKTASILGFYSTSIGIQLLTFQRIIVPSSSVLTVHVNIYQHLKRFLILKMEVL